MVVGVGDGHDDDGRAGAAGGAGVVHGVHLQVERLVVAVLEHALVIMPMAKKKRNIHDATFIIDFVLYKYQ